MHTAVERLLNDLQAAGAHLDTPPKESYLRAHTATTGAYADTKLRWVDIPVPTDEAEGLLAHGFVALRRKKNATTWYLRYSADVLDRDPGAYAEALNLALHQMNLHPGDGGLQD